MSTDARLIADTEFLINTNTVGAQIRPVVAGLADGSFITFWQSADPAIGDASFPDIAGRRWDADGNPLSAEFLANMHTLNTQSEPSVTAMPDGGYVLVWSSQDTAAGDTSVIGISGQRYDATGTPLGTEFLVNTYTASPQYEPVVAALSDGGFVVVWTSFDSAAGDSFIGVSGQRYGSGGTPISGEFLINTNTANNQDAPVVAGVQDGGFVVAWRTSDPAAGDTGGTGIAGRRYDVGGNPIDSEFLVNSNTVNSQAEPAVAAFADGGFIVVWETDDPATGDTSSRGVAAQRYDANGTPLGSEFLINSNTLDAQANSSIAALADGGAIVAWQSSDPATGDTDSSSIVAQRYQSDGVPLGGEFLVNTYTSGVQEQPRVAALVDGGFVVTWVSNDVATGDTDTSGIAARTYQFTRTLIIDVLQRKAGIYDPSNFTLDAVEALPAGSGEVSIVNNKLVFNAGTDFYDLPTGVNREVDINYTWTGNLGQTSNSSVTVILNQIGQSFVSTWETTSPSETITLPLLSSGTYDFNVNWGDGSCDDITAYNQAEVTHTYVSAGSHGVIISGVISGFRFNNSGDKLKLENISNWGSLELLSDAWFRGCSNLTITATDVPIINTSSMLYAFGNCSLLNTIPNIELWDVSAVTNMNRAFNAATLFNQDIDSWDVSSVTTMANMFRDTSFNQDLNSWDVSLVESFHNTFLNAPFNGDISAWNVSSVTTMAGMFDNSSFNQDIDSWDVSSVTTMANMFEGSAFNQDINSWDVSSVSNMSRMFATAANFNGNISSWNVSGVINMLQLFRNTSFNQDISSWDVSSVTSASNMFENTPFNQDISSWDVSNWQNFANMFRGSAFNQDISLWDVSSVTTMVNMFSGSSFGDANYDLLLVAWGNLTLQNGVPFHAGTAKFSAGAPATARANIISTFSWTITDGGSA